jgi:hypothetical protein
MIGDMTGYFASTIWSACRPGLMLKAFITLEGMGRSLDPDFDMAGEAGPVVEQIATTLLAANMARRMQKNLAETLRIRQSALRSQPPAARRTQGPDRGPCRHQPLKEVSNRLDRAVSRSPWDRHRGPDHRVGDRDERRSERCEAFGADIWPAGLRRCRSGWYLAAVLDLAQRA